MTLPGSQNGPAGVPPRRRLIAVGQSDAVAGLRDRTDVELSVARDGLDALGALALAGGNGAVVVALGRDAIEPGELDAFRRAVERLDPNAEVAAFSDAGLESEGLRLVDAPERSPEPANDLHRPAPAAAEPISASPLADALRALLGGRDLPAVLVEHLRARLGDDADVEYVDSAAGRARPAEDARRVVADVARRGVRFGWLIGPAGRAAEVRTAADELALAVSAQRQQEALRAAAFTDPLTGAWNRRYFERFMGRVIEHARRHRHDLTVLLFDIDDFKRYNDRYGHAAGDEILAEIVRLLRVSTRPTDAVCRIGGDEFAVVFYEPAGPREPGSSPPRSIISIARRFQAQVCEHRFPKLGDEARGVLTISGGLATFPWDGHDLESLLDHADRLLRESKSAGKNVIRLGPGARLRCGEDPAGDGA